jgi:hypothetical protein
MKFVCLNCETYMTLEKVEKPAEGSLGVFFTCPSCNAKFSMVTNPGETHIMNSMGLKLSGRAEATAPLEMMRNQLNEQVRTGGTPMAASPKEKKIPDKPPVATGVPSSAEAGEKTGGGCPFSAMVAELGLTTGGKQASDTAPTSGDFTWTPDAREKLDRLPSFVKPMVQGSVEAYARKYGFKTITLQVMDDSKNDQPNGMSWSREAEQRLEKIPDFIRPMARKEIERMAKEQGLAAITGQVMDEAKEKFMKFM